MLRHREKEPEETAEATTILFRNCERACTDRALRARSRKRTFEPDGKPSGGRAAKERSGVMRKIRSKRAGTTHTSHSSKGNFANVPRFTQRKRPKRKRD